MSCTCLGVVYASLASAGPDLTTEETSVIGAGIGSLTILPNTVQVGSTFRITMRGDWRCVGSNLLQMLIIKLNNDHLVSGSIPATGANELCFVSLEVIFTFRSVGVGGSLAATIALSFAGNYDPGEIMENRPNPLAIDTTQPIVISATAILESALAYFKCHNFVVERLS